jgi:hypothetical protein
MSADPFVIEPTSPACTCEMANAGVEVFRGVKDCNERAELRSVYLIYEAMWRLHPAEPAFHRKMLWQGQQIAREMLTDDPAERHSAAESFIRWGVAMAQCRDFRPHPEMIDLTGDVRLRAQKILQAEADPRDWFLVDRYFNIFVSAIRRAMK